MVGMCHRRVKKWGGGAPELGSSVKMVVSGTNVGHSGTDFVGIKGFSGL